MHKWEMWERIDHWERSWLAGWLAGRQRDRQVMRGGRIQVESIPFHCLIHFIVSFVHPSTVHGGA